MNQGHIDTIKLNNSIEELKMLSNEQQLIIEKMNSNNKLISENYVSTNTHLIANHLNSSIDKANIIIDNQTLYIKHLENVIEKYKETAKKVADLFSNISGDI